MVPWSGSDGPFNVVAMDGKTVYQSADQGGGTYAGFMYFRRPAGVNFTAGATLYMEVDYKDTGGPGKFGVQYNAVGNDFMNGNYGFNLDTSNSDTYKTAVFRLDSADFRLAENGSNDLRLTHTQNLRMHVVEVRVSDVPGPAYLAQTAFMGPYTGPTYAGGTPVDSTTMLGKMLCGYQGWFRTPQDDDGFGWFHWTKSFGNMAAGLISEDYWPQMDEFSAAEKHAATGYTYAGGAQAELFSSDNARTVLRHFQWMEAWGIDGVGVQRFTNGLNSPSADGYRVISHVRAAANQTGRTYFIEYDMTGTPEGQLVSNIANDWHTLVDSMQLQNDGRYLHHGGLPVVGVFGFFPERFTPATANAILDIFQTGPVQYRAFVAGAGAWYWRTAVETTPAWTTMMYRMGSWQPWNCGNILGSFPNYTAKSDYWPADKADFQAHGVIYVPELFPGASSANRDNLPFNTQDMPRQGGAFLWKQFVDAYNLGAQSTFLGMFDELDEGTQILKVMTAGQPTQSSFKDYEGQPSDCYLCYASQGAKMLKGQIPFTTTKPNCPAQTQPSIPDPIAPLRGDVVLGPGITYSWTGALALPGGGSVASYEVLLDGVTLSAGAATSLLASTAPGNHVWRVRAVNSLGNAGGWSVAQPFTATGPTATPTRTPSPTSSPTRSATATFSRTASPSRTPSPSPSLTPSASASPTRSVTASVSASSTPTQSRTASPSASVTRSATASPSASATATLTTSSSSTPTRTVTASVTPSNSASASASASPSRSVTPSASPTPTMSTTRSPTPSSSATPSLSATRSLTRSASPSPSETVTLTASSSATLSPSVSVTPSHSPTPSATATRSLTLSTSPTPSSSATRSLTLSSSPTASATPSSTASATPTPSASPSSTSSATATASASPSATLTSSVSPSASATPTRSSTVLGSATSSGTPSVTALASSSATATLTLTLTASSSATPTRSSTASASPSATRTSSATATTTALSSATATNTPAASATPTSTATDSPSPAATPTLIISATAVVSATATLDPTAVITSTSVFSDVAARQLLAVPAPNPNPVAVAVYLDGTVKELRLKIYTRAFTLMAQETYGPAHAGWTALPLPQAFLSTAPNGAYYFMVTAGDVSSLRAKGRLVLNR